MKIGIHVDGPTIRGNEKQAILLAGLLRDRGHEVVVSCLAGGAVEDALRTDGIRCTGVRPRGDADLFHALRFARWLRRERVDGLLLTSWKRAFIAGWAARRAGVPRILLRVGQVHPVREGSRGWKYRFAIPRYHDEVIVNSRVVAEHFSRAIPALHDRLVTIPNGILIAASPPADVRDELGLRASAVLLVGVGGLDRYKRFDRLIDAVAHLDGDVHAVIVGEGPQREALLARAADAGVAGRVHLLGHRTDVSGVLAACDLCVVTSDAEGMSVAMLEAAAAGVPIVSTDVGGAWELLAARDGRPAGGWIVPRDRPDALVSAMREALEMRRQRPAEAKARLDEAAWRLSHWFAPETMAAAYETALTPRRRR